MASPTELLAFLQGNVLNLSVLSWLILSYLLFHLVSAPVAVSVVPVKLPKTDLRYDPGEGGEQISAVSVDLAAESDPAESEQLDGD